MALFSKNIIMALPPHAERVIGYALSQIPFQKRMPLAACFHKTYIAGYQAFNLVL